MNCAKLFPYWFHILIASEWQMNIYSSRITNNKIISTVQKCSINIWVAIHHSSEAQWKSAPPTPNWSASSCKEGRLKRANGIISALEATPKTTPFTRLQPLLFQQKRRGHQEALEARRVLTNRLSCAQVDCYNWMQAICQKVCNSW